LASAGSALAGAVGWLQRSTRQPARQAQRRVLPAVRVGVVIGGRKG
jgi:hypothetical protein